jgi:hypothetical protein
MNTGFSKLGRKDWLILCGVMVVGFGWLLIDQIFLSEVYQRFIALSVLLLLLFYVQFIIIKPKEVYAYSNSLAMVCCLFIVIVSVIIHVIIKHDFSYKSLLILVNACVIPYVSGGIYYLTHKKK